MILRSFFPNVRLGTVCAPPASARPLHPICVPSFADGFRCVPRGWAVSAEHVFSVRDGFDVAWVDAARVPAQMIQREAVRDRTDKERVHEAVSGWAALRIAERPSDVDEPVALFVFPSGPFPTPRSEPEPLRNEIPNSVGQVRAKILMGKHCVLLYGTDVMGRGEGCYPSRPALYSPPVNEMCAS